MSLYYHPPLFIILAVGWFLNYHQAAISNIEQGQGQEQEQGQKNPVSYAFKFLNSPETQRQYPKRLKLLFDHIGFAQDSLEAQGQAFLDRTRENPQWAQEKIIDFIDFHTMK